MEVVRSLVGVTDRLETTEPLVDAGFSTLADGSTAVFERIEEADLAVEAMLREDGGRLGAFGEGTGVAESDFDAFDDLMESARTEGARLLRAVLTDAADGDRGGFEAAAAVALSRAREAAVDLIDERVLAPSCETVRTRRENEGCEGFRIPARCVLVVPGSALLRPEGTESK